MPRSGPGRRGTARGSDTRTWPLRAGPRARGRRRRGSARALRSPPGTAPRRSCDDAVRSGSQVLTYQWPLPASRGCVRHGPPRMGPVIPALDAGRVGGGRPRPTYRNPAFRDPIRRVVARDGWTPATASGGPTATPGRLAARAVVPSRVRVWGCDRVCFATVLETRASNVGPTPSRRGKTDVRPRPGARCCETRTNCGGTPRRVPRARAEGAVLPRGRTEPAEFEERDPPTGPARHRLQAQGTSQPLARVAKALAAS